MHRHPTGRSTHDRSDEIVQHLTARQHLHPHQPLRDVLEALVKEMNCCPEALQKAVLWLGVDASLAIGRLRRSELLQLSRSIARFWSSELSDFPVENSPL